ncbi:Hypothetical protein MVR_LOCUS208, partial [uncultured virus]
VEGRCKDGQLIEGYFRQVNKGLAMRLEGDDTESKTVGAGVRSNRFSIVTLRDLEE